MTCTVTFIHQSYLLVPIFFFNLFSITAFSHIWPVTWEQDNSSTRQLIDTVFGDNSSTQLKTSTLFEDNSSTHYYLAIIPKLIKWRQCFSIKVIYYHVYDQNNEFRILIPYFWFLIQFQISFKPHTTAGANKLTHCIFNVWYTWNFLKTFLIKTKVDGKWSWIFVCELFCHLFPNFLMFEL